LQETKGPGRPAKPADEKRTERLQTYVEPLLAAEFVAAVSRRGRNVSDVLRELVRAYLDADKKTGNKLS
jgi:hypothetical protein